MTNSAAAALAVSITARRRVTRARSVHASGSHRRARVMTDFEVRFNVQRATKASMRNREPIARAFESIVAAHPRANARALDVLELGAGAGVHAEAIARACEGSLRSYAPTDVFDGCFAAARDNCRDRDVVREPVVLDACSMRQGVAKNSIDALVVINVIHISSERALVGMFDGARWALRDDGFVFCYGPFTRGGKYASEGDERFDKELRERDPVNFGLVDVERVDAEAKRVGLTADARSPVEMPANNVALVYRKT